MDIEYYNNKIRKLNEKIELEEKNDRERKS